MELKTPEKEKVLKRKNFLEEIRKANSLEYVTEWGDPEKIGVSKAYFYNTVSINKLNFNTDWIHADD